MRPCKGYLPRIDEDAGGGDDDDAAAGGDDDDAGGSQFLLLVSGEVEAKEKILLMPKTRSGWMWLFKIVKDELYEYVSICSVFSKILNMEKQAAKLMMRLGF